MHAKISLHRGKFPEMLTLVLMLPALAQGCGGPRETVQGEALIEPITVGATPNVSVYEEEFVFAGQPDAQSLASFADMGVKTVINLRSEDEMSGLDFDERDVVAKLGMRYVNIEVLKKGAEARMIEAVMDELDAAAGEKTLIHCAGSVRVGYAWSIYRGVRHGLSANEAIAEGKMAGLDSRGLEERARKFIVDAAEKL